MKNETFNEENFPTYKETEKFDAIVKELNTDEKLIWYDEESYKYEYILKKILSFFLILGSPVIFGIFIVLFKFIEDAFINQANLIYVIYFIYSVIVFFIFRTIYKFLIDTYNSVYAFGISSKRLFFVFTKTQYHLTSYQAFFSNISDIKEIENLKITKGNFVKFRINTVFYSSLWDKKVKEILVSPREIFLDEKGLDTLTKLIKEQAPNAVIKL